MENKRFEITETAGSVKGFYVVVDKKKPVSIILLRSLAQALAFALNARTAADAIRQREFDLVLLDINLPDGNGFELCKLIKPQHPDTIVIFLTANDQERDQIQSYEVGAVVNTSNPMRLPSVEGVPYSDSVFTSTSSAPMA